MNGFGSTNYGDNLFTRGLNYNPQTGGFTSALLGGIGAPQAQPQGQQPSVLDSVEGGAGSGGGGGSSTIRIPGIGPQGGSSEPSIFGLGTRWLNPQQGSSVGSLFGGWMPDQGQQGATPFEQAMNVMPPKWSKDFMPNPNPINFRPTPYSGTAGEAAISPYSQTGQPLRYTPPPRTLGELLGVSGSGGEWAGLPRRSNTELDLMGRGIVPMPTGY